MSPRTLAGLWLLFVLGLCTAVPAQQQPPYVAVFNFQKKAGPESWAWLEKGLADRVITELWENRGALPVDRDNMQRVADQMSWAPEMMSDPGKLQMIEQAVKAQYVISGVYEIHGKDLSITAVIVDCRTRRPVGQREAKGTTDKVIDVMARLSAGLQSWFSKETVDKHLQGLPPWTKNVDAARAVYEGIDLYDHGRYHEAWLQFREAAARDKAYSEAHYWVGRMYYFMHRYEHARRALEKFLAAVPTQPKPVDEDAKRRLHSLANATINPVELERFYSKRAWWHPIRAGWALKEYVHCLEHDTADPYDLVDAYMALIYRFPRIAVPSEMHRKSVASDGWLYTRAALVLRDNRKLDLALGASNRARNLLGWGFASYYAGGFFRECVFEKHFLTGKVPPHPGEISFQAKPDRRTPALRFRPPGGKQRVFDQMSLTDSNRSMPWLLVTTNNCVFTKLACRPIMTRFGPDTAIRFTVSTDEFGSVARQVMKVSEAVKRGFVIDELPRTGMLELGIEFIAMSDETHWIKDSYVYEGLQLATKVEETGAHGSIRVRCDNASDFAVKLDGKPARINPGVVGLLSPKTYELTLCPTRTNAPFGEWSASVAVEEGKTAEVVGHLPWKPGSPWKAWKRARIPTREMRLIAPGLQRSHIKQPAVLADDKAIRVVWVRRGDLWTMTSRDGETFSVPRKLASPVSTGWLEDGPSLIRDESGRFVLAFVSDRNQKRLDYPYVCWSRDMVHWSVPTLLAKVSAEDHQIMVDDDGRYLWVGSERSMDGDGRRVTIHSSLDLYTWKRLATLTFPDLVWTVKIFQRNDGHYDLFVGLQGIQPHGEAKDGKLFRMVSDDAVHWKNQGHPLNVGKPESIKFSLMPVGHTWVAAAFQQPQGPADVNVGLGAEWNQLVVWTLGSGGTWSRKLVADNLTRISATMAYHKKWGYMLAWAEFPLHREGEMLKDKGPTRRVLSSHLEAGRLYFMRGPGFDER